MDIFSELEKLNFPQDKYMVIGGAAMAGRGIKQTKDLDLLLSRDFIEALRTDSAWHHHPRIIPTEGAGLVNESGTVELYPTIGGFELGFDELVERVEMINGFPFAHLEDVMKIKKTYNREKDLKDIELIEMYISQQSTE
jgi:hypothetical protein